MNSRILLPLLVIAALLLGACGVNVNLNIDRGSGNVITQSRDVSNFDSINLSGIGDVTITQGNTESLQIEAEDNVISHIRTEVKDGTLNIGFDNKAILPTKSIKFNVSVRNIHGLKSSGASNIQSDKINTDRLNIGISGTGNIDLRSLTADQLTVDISGAGNFTALGKVTGQKITMSGAGNYNGQDLESKTADITISGLGKASTWVTDQLKVTISGTGGVDYYGSPQVTQQISGLGSVKHVGDK